jgi:hypothetical protein
MIRHGRLLPACALLVGLAWAAPAPAAVIVSPPGANTPGTGQGVDPFTTRGDLNGNRYQQIYSSSFFTAVGPLQQISEVAFRPRQGALGNLIGNTLTISNLIVRLSTTGRTPDTDFPTGLSADLNLNPGADAMTVFSGPITFTTDRLFGDTDVEDFDFRIVFQNGFLYQPGLGNLLLEVIIPPGPATTVRSNGTIGFTQLDSFIDGFPSRDGTASATDANLLDGLTVGSNSSTGAVTRFTVNAVPEPATVAVFSVGLGATILAARRRKRTT